MLWKILAAAAGLVVLPSTSVQLARIEWTLSSPAFLKQHPVLTPVEGVANQLERLAGHWVKRWVATNRPTPSARSVVDGLRQLDRRALGRLSSPRGAGLASGPERRPPQVHAEGVRRALQPGSAPPQPRASAVDGRSPARRSWRSSPGEDQAGRTAARVQPRRRLTAGRLQRGPSHWVQSPPSPSNRVRTRRSCASRWSQDDPPSPFVRHLERAVDLSSNVNRPRFSGDSAAWICAPALASH